MARCRQVVGGLPRCFLLMSLPIQRWSGSFTCTASWKAHDGIVLSSIVVPSSSTVEAPTTSGVLAKWTLITGASDNHIKVRGGPSSTTFELLTAGSRISNSALGYRASSSAQLPAATPPLCAVFCRVPRSEIHFERSHCSYTFVWTRRTYIIPRDSAG
jgi:di- and tripeptidase